MPVRVLHVITGLGVGGAEGQLAALLLAGGRFAEGAAVAALGAGGAWAPRLRAAGVPVAELGMARDRGRAAGVRRLADMLRLARPAVVQGWMYHANLAALAALALAGRRRGTRLLWGLRCSAMDAACYPPALARVVRAGALLSRLPDAVVANADEGRRAHLALGYRPRRFAVVPNGVDAARFRPDPAARAAVRAELGLGDGAPLLAHVARVDPMKDHATFLAALDRLPGVTALAAGAGTEGLPARPGLLRLGVRDDVPRLLAAADVAVSSSAFGEGFANAVAEAMAAGVPPVATDVGDARAIVGDAGAIVPPRDPAALAGAVARLLALAPSARLALGAAARARVARDFSLAASAAAYVALQEGPL